MEWDPVRTLRNALWITGGQGAGKTTVAGILAERYAEAVADRVADHFREFLPA